MPGTHSLMWQLAAFCPVARGPFPPWRSDHSPSDAFSRASKLPHRDPSHSLPAAATSCHPAKSHPGGTCCPPGGTSYRPGYGTGHGPGPRGSGVRPSRGSLTQPSWTRWLHPGPGELLCLAGSQQQAPSLSPWPRSTLRADPATPPMRGHLWALPARARGQGARPEAQLQRPCEGSRLARTPR